MAVSNYVSTDIERINLCAFHRIHVDTRAVPYQVAARDRPVHHPTGQSDIAQVDNRIANASTLHSCKRRLHVPRLERYRPQARARRIEDRVTDR